MQKLKNLTKILIFELLIAFSSSNLEAVKYNIVENRQIIVGDFKKQFSLNDNYGIKAFGSNGHITFKNCYLIIDGFHPLTCQHGGRIDFVNCIIVIGLGSQIPQPMMMDRISRTTFTKCIITFKKEASIPILSDQISIDSQTTFIQPLDSETNIAVSKFINHQFVEIARLEMDIVSQQIKDFVQKAKDAELIAQREAEILAQKDFPDSDFKDDSDSEDTESVSVTPNSPRDDLVFPESPIKS